MRCGGKFLLAAVIALGASDASAEGTLGLDEVLVAVGNAPKLVAEIQAELGKSNLKAENVTCIGARHGNHWKISGAGPARPPSTRLGRSLHPHADRVYFDPRGKLLGDLDKADPKRAKTFQESNFRWTWTP